MIQEKLQLIYLDNAATTKPCTAALDAFLSIAADCYANPSSLHQAGVDAEQKVLEAKQVILSHFSQDGDLVFTSGATESNNMAIRGAACANRRYGQHIVTTAIEHPSVHESVCELEKQGYTVTRVAPGPAIEDALCAAVQENTALISVIQVNNETGYVIDTDTVYRTIKAQYPKCIVHVDGVQGFLKRPLSGDLISISAHKLHGCKGIGGLFVRKGVRIPPLLYGGGQQGNLRSGTIPTELICAFAAAVQDFHYDEQHSRNLAERLMQLLSGIDGVLFNREAYGIYLPGIVNFSATRVRSEVLLHFLAAEGIYVSSGSACAQGQLSDVLRAFGADHKRADSAVRVSFSKSNTVEEIERFYAVLQRTLKRLCR